MLNKVYYKIPPLTFAQNFARLRKSLICATGKFYGCRKRKKSAFLLINGKNADLKLKLRDAPLSFILFPFENFLEVEFFGIIHVFRCFAIIFGSYVMEVVFVYDFNFV